VARAGDNPRSMHLVRLGEGWSEHGSRVCYPDVLQPMPWAKVGRCWDGVHHAVVDATNAVFRPRPSPGVAAAPRDGGI